MRQVLSFRGSEGDPSLGSLPQHYARLVVSGPQRRLLNVHSCLFCPLLFTVPRESPQIIPNATHLENRTVLGPV